ncbi:wax ester/triacylglycerol synthase family O-acyltransferase [Amycolatopsis cynarae]|uniref:Diacylglycerol O-acyltransferase n=1 Tax=Amycolatopsis cynarae TaxID=2995223 RepID=A0ABY7B9C3_9PSEU|nr:wax ester/triacylglycerol synthase family O-acyltransferase [Amycolatopsis sp. HUAS 11-8]WAL68950.1 wax ester/triacylglycerol synthase family O-acyltransferase [Amycolatopsis sp. HUAS 11-8]
MEPLNPLDAAFLEIEDADPAVVLAIASVAVAEGPAPSQQELVAEFTARLPLIPRYRQKIHRVPLDLGTPSWVDDPDFDPARQFHRVAVPEPGDEAGLCELVGMLMAQRLDRDRPLWECWVIEGLTGGRWAILSKVHHCLADGVSGNTLHEVFFREQDRPPPPLRPAEPSPGRMPLLAAALRDMVVGPLTTLRAAFGALTKPRALAGRVTEASQGLEALMRAVIPVSPSSLSGPIGRMRRYELAHASLPKVVAIAKAFDVTVNDVVLAAITAAYRELLLSRGEEPAADSVRTLVPVSVRREVEIGRMDNQVSLMLPLLPVDVADPALRLVTVHRRLAELKGHREAEAGVAVTTSARYGPYAPLAWTIRAAARLPHRNVVSVATNVPGPRHTLSVLGREVTDLYPYVPIAMRLRTGVAVLTYRDRMSFGITADAGTAPEPGLMSAAIERDLTTLSRTARTKKKKTVVPKRNSSH